MKKSNLNAMVAHSMRCFPAALTVSVLLAAFAPFVLGADELKFANLEESRAEYDRSVKTLLAKKCGDCHQEDKQI